MIILNLVYPGKSDINYKISKFPDGQQNIIIEKGVEYKQGHNDKLHNCYIQIKSRLNNWLDLELITCAVASLRELGVEEIHLYVPYIMGARSDRKFEEGGNNYIKDVLAPAINSLNFKTVTCIDPHSDVLEACIKGFRKESNLKLIDFSLFEIYQDKWRKQSLGEGNFKYWLEENKGFENCILVSPDAGASKKIYKLAEQIGYKGDIITCGKDRDKDGKLTRTSLPLSFNPQNNEDVIIIDDICDGGATFVNITKIIKDNHNWKNCKIYLIVTHGIFSKDFKELSQYFDGIYCTNSYKDIDDKFKEAFEHYNGKDSGVNIIKQLNVF